MTICKIGGSLFDFPGLQGVIRRLPALRPRSPLLLVPGGGAAASAVRIWDKAHRLGEEAAHGLALAAMDLAGELLATLVPELRLVRSAQQARMAAAEGAIGLLCADCFIKSSEAAGHAALEHSWRVTSDSIAAWTAIVLGSAELILVKSVPLPPGISLSDAATAGLVDEAFPEIAPRVPALSWINARSEPMVAEPWSVSRS